MGFPWKGWMTDESVAGSFYPVEESRGKEERESGGWNDI